MRKTFLHVGFPKTATTTFDTQLFPALAGVRYLGALQRTEPIRKVFEVEILSRDRLEYCPQAVHEAFWSQIAAATADDPRPLLLSNHSLTFTWTNHVDRLTVAERLRQLFDDAEILIVVRHQIRLLESMYRHLLTNGVYVNFTTFIQGIEREYCRGPLPQLKFHDVVRMYESLFGRERVHVLCYEDLVHEPDAFVRQLFAALHIDEPIPALSVSNSSLGSVALEFKRFVNRWVPHALGRPPFVPSRRPTGAEVDPGNFQHRYRQITNAIARGIDRWCSPLGKGPLRFPPGVKQRIAALYGDSNRLLAAERGLPFERYTYPGFEA